MTENNIQAYWQEKHLFVRAWPEKWNIFGYNIKWTFLKVTWCVASKYALTSCFPGGTSCKEPAGDRSGMDSIPGSGRSPGQGHGKPLHYFCLENPMDRGVWRATVHGVAQSRTQLKQLSTHACRVVRQLAFLLCSPLYADSVKREADNLQQGGSRLPPNNESAGCWILDVYFQNCET